MEKSQQSFEYAAPTVEEAIAKGLDDLGVERDDVDIEILDEGKRNVFRFASRDAQVRLTLRSQVVPPTTFPSEEEIPDELTDEEIALELQGSPADISDLAVSIEQILSDILAKMSVKATITTRLSQSDDDREVVYANIEGDDLSFLIGRKAETMNALQFLTGLILSKRANRWIPVQVDVQGYRARRETELKKIAHRMAQQTITTGRKQFLEPMPANERRIIHMEVRGYDQLVSESMGEEPNRKVTISLKK